MTNYLKFDLDGKEVGLKFGLPAVRRISESAEKYPISDTQGNYNELGTAHILFSGYLNNQLIKELPAEYSFEDFADFVEKSWLTRDTTEDWKNCVAAVEFFSQSFVVKSLIDQQKKSPMMTTPTKESSDPTSLPIGTGLNHSAMANSV